MGTCATDAARSFITVEFWINYVTENHIWVKTDSCLGTKSVVKGDLFDPLKCIFKSMSVSL